MLKKIAIIIASLTATVVVLFIALVVWLKWPNPRSRCEDAYRDKKWDMALTICEQAVNKGFKSAHGTLGMLSRDGKVVPKDLDKAREQFELAISAGDTSFYGPLAALYRLKEFSGYDIEKGKELFIEGVSWCEIDLVIMLSMDYAAKGGVYGFDPVEARKWLIVGTLMAKYPERRVLFAQGIKMQKFDLSQEENEEANKRALAFQESIGNKTCP